MIHDSLDYISRPLVGVTASFGSVVVSLLPHLETGMRVGTLAIGFCVAILTLRKMWRDRNK
jgi:hypothetical protein